MKWLLLLAIACQGADLRVTYVVPPWFKYRTVQQDGTVEAWMYRPRLLKTDGGGAVWVNEESARIIVPGCKPIKHWRTSLRRLR